MRTIDTFQIGETGSFTKTVTEADVVMYAGVTGDLNPAHINDEWAKKGQFGGRIAHGMLSVGFISCVIGTIMPGPGTIYKKQEVDFKKPVYIGDTVTATLTVIDIIPDRNRIIIDTTVTNQYDEVVITGKAVVMPPKEDTGEK